MAHTIQSNTSSTRDKNPSGFNIEDKDFKGQMAARYQELLSMGYKIPGENKLGTKNTIANTTHDNSKSIKVSREDKRPTETLSIGDCERLNTKSGKDDKAGHQTKHETDSDSFALKELINKFEYGKFIAEKTRQVGARSPKRTLDTPLIARNAWSPAAAMARLELDSGADTSSSIMDSCSLSSLCRNNIQFANSSAFGTESLDLHLEQENPVRSNTINQIPSAEMVMTKSEVTGKDDRHEKGEQRDVHKILGRGEDVENGDGKEKAKNSEHRQQQANKLARGQYGDDTLSRSSIKTNTLSRTGSGYRSNMKQSTSESKNNLFPKVRKLSDSNTQVPPKPAIGSSALSTSVNTDSPFNRISLKRKVSLGSFDRQKSPGFQQPQKQNRPKEKLKPLDTSRPQPRKPAANADSRHSIGCSASKSLNEPPDKLQSQSSTSRANISSKRLFKTPVKFTRIPAKDDKSCGCAKKGTSAMERYLMFLKRSTPSPLPLPSFDIEGRNAQRKEQLKDIEAAKTSEISSYTHKLVDNDSKDATKSQEFPSNDLSSRKKDSASQDIDSHAIKESKATSDTLSGLINSSKSDKRQQALQQEMKLMLQSFERDMSSPRARPTRVVTRLREKAHSHDSLNSERSSRSNDDKLVSSITSGIGQNRQSIISSSPFRNNGTLPDISGMSTPSPISHLGKPHRGSSTENNQQSRLSNLASMFRKSDSSPRSVSRQLTPKYPFFNLVHPNNDAGKIASLQNYIQGKSPTKHHQPHSRRRPSSIVDSSLLTEVELADTNLVPVHLRHLSNLGPSAGSKHESGVSPMRAAILDAVSSVTSTDEEDMSYLALSDRLKHIKAGEIIHIMKKDGLRGRSANISPLSRSMYSDRSFHLAHLPADDSRIGDVSEMPNKSRDGGVISVNSSHSEVFTSSGSTRISSRHYPPCKDVDARTNKKALTDITPPQQLNRKNSTDRMLETIRNVSTTSIPAVKEKLGSETSLVFSNSSCSTGPPQWDKMFCQMWRRQHEKGGDGSSGPTSPPRPQQQQQELHQGQQQHHHHHLSSQPPSTQESKLQQQHKQPPKQKRAATSHAVGGGGVPTKPRIKTWNSKKKGGSVVSKKRRLLDDDSKAGSVTEDMQTANTTITGSQNVSEKKLLKKQMLMKQRTSSSLKKIPGGKRPKETSKSEKEATTEKSVGGAPITVTESSPKFQGASKSPVRRQTPETPQVLLSCRNSTSPSLWQRDSVKTVTESKPRSAKIRKTRPPSDLSCEPTDRWPIKSRLPVLISRSNPASVQRNRLEVLSQYRRCLDDLTNQKRPSNIPVTPAFKKKLEEAAWEEYQLHGWTQGDYVIDESLKNSKNSDSYGRRPSETEVSSSKPLGLWRMFPLTQLKCVYLTVWLAMSGFAHLASRHYGCYEANYNYECKDDDVMCLSTKMFS